MAETHHKFGEPSIELLRWWDWDRELQELEGVIIFEVDFREVASPEAAKKPKSMTIPFPGSHGHGVRCYLLIMICREDRKRSR